MSPLLEMRRLAGKVAVLLTAVYLLGLTAAAVGVARGANRPLVDWVLLAVPAAAFVPATVYAVKVHRTSDLAMTRVAWRWSLLLAVLGTGLLIGATAIWRRADAS
jgi:hypothetical protein